MSAVIWFWILLVYSSAIWITFNTTVIKDDVPCTEYKLHDCDVNAVCHLVENDQRFFQCRCPQGFSDASFDPIRFPGRICQRDKDKRCSSWVANGECESDPFGTLVACDTSCGGGCAKLKAECNKVDVKCKNEYYKLKKGEVFSEKCDHCWTGNSGDCGYLQEECVKAIKTCDQYQQRCSKVKAKCNWWHTNLKCKNGNEDHCLPLWKKCKALLQGCQADMS